VGVTVIRVNGVSKTFSLNRQKSVKERLVNFGRERRHREAFCALRDISLEIDAGTTLGLIGHNGSGKSTLLKIIGGILTPDQGYVERRGRLAALLEVGAGFHGDLTGRENVYLNASILGLTKKQTQRYFDEILAFADIGDRFIDTQVKFYSSGMYVRLAFAVAVHVDPEVLLIDEVLAVGDEPFQRKCIERIKSFQREGRTIILVTHDLGGVRQLCDRAVLLDHGDVIVDGTAVQAVRTFRERYTQEPVAQDSFGTGQACIEAVRLLDARGRPHDRFEPGDALQIQVDVSAQAPVEDWAVGIAIEDHMDNVIYGTNTKLQKMTFAPLVDGARITFQIPRLPMLEGQYYVSVAVHDGTGGIVYHRLDRRSAFRVFSDGSEVGYIQLQPEIRVTPSRAEHLVAHKTDRIADRLELR
jgi:ABC-2 type transport system ATP-binding protein